MMSRAELALREALVDPRLSRATGMCLHSCWHFEKITFRGGLVVGFASPRTGPQQGRPHPVIASPHG